MALAYRAGAVGGTTTNTTTGLSITVPTSGTGGTVVAGDVAIACIETGGANTFTAAPTGWTQRALTSNGQSNITGAIYTKTLVSGDINAAAAWTINAASNIAAAIDIFSGADESSFVYSTMAVGTGTTVTSPTITVPASGMDFGFWMGAITAGAAFTFTKDATYTAASTRATSVVSGQNRTMGTAFISASGSTAGVGCTFSASTNRNAVFSIALAPGTPVTVAGAVTDLALAPLTPGPVLISMDGGVANLAIAYVPNGTVNAAATLAAPSTPGVALAPLAGTVTAAQTLAGGVADLAITAPAGSVSAAATIAGPAPPGIAIAPLAGGFGGATVITGETADLAFEALVGTVFAQAVVNVTASPAAMTIAAPAGSVHTAVTLLADDVATVFIQPLAGTAFGGIPVTLTAGVATLLLEAPQGLFGPPRDIALVIGAMRRTWSSRVAGSSWSAGEPESKSVSSQEIQR